MTGRNGVLWGGLILILYLNFGTMTFAQRGANFGFRSKDEAKSSYSESGIGESRDFGASSGDLFRYLSSSASDYIFDDTKYKEKIREKEHLIQDRTETYQKKKIEVQKQEEMTSFNNFSIPRPKDNDKIPVIDEETARRLELVFYGNINNNIRWKEFLWPVMSERNTKISDPPFFTDNTSIPTGSTALRNESLRNDARYEFNPAHYGFFRYFNHSAFSSRSVELSLFDSSRISSPRKFSFIVKP